MFATKRRKTFIMELGAPLKEVVLYFVKESSLVNIVMSFMDLGIDLNLWLLLNTFLKFFTYSLFFSLYFEENLRAVPNWVKMILGKKPKPEGSISKI